MITAAGVGTAIDLKP